MLAPVVVKPDTVSNSASIKLGIYPLIKKGRQPATENPIHARATIRNPPRALKDVSLGFENNDTQPKAVNPPIVTPNANKVFSPLTNAIIKGTNINPAINRASCPNMCAVIL